jgi:hypothetical protein
MIKPALVRRVAAAQAIHDRMRGKAHRWVVNDCGKMVGLHARRLGYKVELPKLGDYTTPAGALKWLKKRGYDSLDARLDDLWPQIAPAAALVGDVLALESVDALAALVIHMGQGQYLGFHEDSDAAVLMRPTAFVRAWSVLP